MHFVHLHPLHFTCLYQNQRPKTSSFSGQEYRKNDASIKVDFNTSDPVVRWDSYENFNLHHQDSIESEKCTHSQWYKNFSFKQLFAIKHEILVPTRYLPHEGPSRRQPVRPGEKAPWAGVHCLHSVTQRVPHKQPNSQASSSQPPTVPQLQYRIQPLLVSL